MSVRTITVPEAARPGVGLVTVGGRRVSAPERQGAAVEAVVRARRSREGPSAGLLSYSILTATTG